MLAMQPAAAQPEAPAHVLKYVADARVAGQGRLTWLGFHVYDAALYAPAGFTAAGSAASPFVLELTYARKLSGKAIAERSRDEIERLGYGTSEQRARWLAQMSAIFPDVEKGKRLAGVNVPGGGARFYLDGRFLGTTTRRLRRRSSRSGSTSARLRRNCARVCWGRRRRRGVGFDDGA
jgi:hypothetical protein